MPTRFAPDDTPDEFLACQRLLDALLPAHRLRALLLAAGSPAAALALSEADLTRNPAIALTAKQAERLHLAAKTPQPAMLARQAASLGVWVITSSDPVYPRHLAEFSDAPPLLFVRGDLQERDANSVAIVGSRRATNYGFGQADRFARVFAEYGLTLVSGGALGIDTAAHRGALAGGGRTIAILGCGVDISYPSENRDLFAEIVGRGALLSEFALGSRPEPWRFPTRNRIIAGISRVTLVIETPRESGAMITARDAAGYGRDVWAVPGTIGAGDRSRGCHLLIQEGAGLADAPEDILRSLGIAVAGDAEAEVGLPRSPTGTRRRNARSNAEAAESLPATSVSTPATLNTLDLDSEEPPMSLSESESKLLRAFGQEPKHVDEASFAAGLPAAESAVALTLLEMKGLLQRLPGNLYVRPR